MPIEIHGSGALRKVFCAVQTAAIHLHVAINIDVIVEIINKLYTLKQETLLDACSDS